MLKSKWIKNDYIVTVSYDNYWKGKGGTDKVILSQQHIYNRMDITTIHLWPYKKSNGGDFYFWEVAIDGEEKDVLSTNHFLNFLISDGMSKKRLKAFIIHHLLGIEISELWQLTDYLPGRKYFYLHDYYTICPYGGLAFNGYQYCSEGFPIKEKCIECKFCKEDIEERVEHIRKFIIEHQEFNFIIPSESAAKIWSSHYPECRERIRVIPHQLLYDYYQENVLWKELEQGLKVAYIGDQREIKGWSQWYEAVQKLSSERKNLSFYHFGHTETHCDNIKEILCDFNDDLNDMIKKLRDYRPDCVILWSQIPETYSYTYYEAYAANQFVIAQEGSGNIEFQIQQNGNGYIVEKEKLLVEVLDDTQILFDVIKEYRRKRIKVPGRLEDNSLIPEEIKNDGGRICDFLQLHVTWTAQVVEIFYRIYSLWKKEKTKFRNKFRKLLFSKV